MRTLKKLLAFFLCAVICCSLITTVSAATTPTITVTSVEAKVGDTVNIDLEISNNPGIMAMAFCITYDNQVLEYVESSCNIDKSYTTTKQTEKNHEDKGHVSIVLVESKDNTKNGKILSLSFVVKNDIAGKHPITLANSNREKYGTKLHNSFSNSKQEFILPKIISGGVTVPETCENSGHKYGDWEIIKNANCTETGLRKHTCVRCNITEENEIPITHEFEDVWTVDKEATPTEDGIMSRHCKKCDEVTDIITFSYEEIGGDNDDSGNDASSDNESASDTSSDNESGSNSTVSDTTTDTDSSSDDSTQDEKPNINNVVGEKVPLKEAEKLDGYQQITKPSLDNSTSSIPDTSAQDTASETISDNSDTTTGVIENNSSADKNKEPSFLSTPAGVITAIICAILSIGIILLGVLLIIKNKKQ